MARTPFGGAYCMNPTVPIPSSAEAVKHEIAFCLEEYKAVRAEIVATLTSSFNTLALTLTAAAGLITLATFQFSASRKPYWLAIAPLVFYALLWVQLRLAYNVFNLGNFIGEILSPRLKNAIAALAPGNSDLPPPFLWETFARTPAHSDELWLLPIEAARFVIPLVCAAASFITYLYLLYISTDLQFDVYFDGLRIAVNITLLSYSIYTLVRMRALLRTRPTLLNMLHRSP